MAIAESVDIAAYPETVWPLVADPVRHGDWNSKVVSIEREAVGPVELHERFGMLYKMRNRENQTQVEVIACESLRRVTFEHRTQWAGKEQITIEAYEISDIAHGVRLTQTIDMSRALPWWARALIWFIHKTGKSVGEKPLDRLRQLAEPQPASDSS